MSHSEQQTRSTEDIQELPPSTRIWDYIAQLKEQVAFLERLASEHPELTGANIQNLTPGTSSEAVRRAIFDIYDRAAKVLGRNSPEAIKADLSHTIGRWLSLGLLKEYKRGENANSPDEWITNLTHIVDKDSQEIAWHMSVYAKIAPVFHKLLSVARARGTTRVIVER